MDEGRKLRGFSFGSLLGKPGAGIALRVVTSMEVPTLHDLASRSLQPMLLFGLQTDWSMTMMAAVSLPMIGLFTVGIFPGLDIGSAVESHLKNFQDITEKARNG